MTTPLYSGCEKPANCDKGGNLGLWFERFFDQYNEHRNWEVLKPTTNNNQMGNAYWLLKHFNGEKAGNTDKLASHAKAQMQLAASLQGQSHVFKASWHFVTGMGNPHPVENGFAWHPTLGVPYLTGAAVKGLVRSYIENYLDTDNPDNPDKKKLLLQWFGSDHKNPKEQTYDSQAGELIFFDALPIKPVTLGVDIMTPHMGKWYEQGGTNPNQPSTIPADWHDPVPVSFLVAKEVTLLFSFASRQYPNADGKRPAIDLADVADVLNRALEQAGAGGKTATGYGGMHVEILSCPWVDETIQALATKNRVPENKRDQVIYGKGLAEAWQALTDETVKKAALTDIRSRWKSDMWDDPQGSSVKAAKKIYTGV